MQIVPATSAIVPAVDANAIPLNKDHINLVKFTSVDDVSFQIVLHHISSMIQDAKPKVAHNWEREISKLMVIILEHKWADHLQNLIIRKK
jgi:hypothetical protein